MVKIKIVKRTTPFKIRDPKTTYSEYINDFQNRVAWIIKIKITYIFEKIILCRGGVIIKIVFSSKSTFQGNS